jgi:hypothetical protein
MDPSKDTLARRIDADYRSAGALSPPLTSGFGGGAAEGFDLVQSVRSGPVRADGPALYPAIRNYCKWQGRSETFIVPEIARCLQGTILPPVAARLVSAGSMALGHRTFW